VQILINSCNIAWLGASHNIGYILSFITVKTIVVISYCPNTSYQLHQGRIFYIIPGYSSGKSLPFLLRLLNKFGKVTHFCPVLSGKSLWFSGKYSPLNCTSKKRIVNSQWQSCVKKLENYNIAYKSQQL